MGLESSVSLLVAALDLKEIQLIRGAMRAADVQSAAAAGPLAPQRRIERRFRLHPEPVIEPRRHIHPEPRYESRPVLHPAPRLAITGCYQCPCVMPGFRAGTHNLGSPVQAPWAVLPWQNPPQPAQKVKMIIRRSDTAAKGSMIDIFI